MRLPSRAVKVLAAAALPLALAACSAGSSDSSDGSATAATPTRAKDPNTGLPTGTQLKKALAPASFFPSGFTVDTDGTRDTGGTYQSPATRSAAKPDCSGLDGTGWIDLTGVAGVSFAQSAYVDKNTSEEIAQEIDVYRGTTSADVLKAVERIVTACPGFTDSDTHSKVTVSGRATPGLGDAAYTITLTDGAWQNGTTLIAARAGTAVVSVLSTDGHDNGAATAKKLAARVVASLKGKTDASGSQHG
ncbi:hypothetical protein ACWCP6_23495 [Streptomyces sp. NPDC002004]